MARTYTLKSTACAGGVHAGWTSATWGDYYAANQRRAGSVDYDSYTNYYATYFMFDSSTLASLKSKPISSITLTVNVTGGTGIQGSTGTSYAIRAKANANTSGGETWRGGDTILGYCRRTSGSNTIFSIPLSTTVPDYGYVIGPYGATPGQDLFQTFGTVESGVYATLTIVTNEYTINYNKGANGTGTNVTDIKTHGTALTLRGAIFSRTGYNQTGWSTSDGGSKAYNLSASYTANADATLYPYWQKITYQVSYNANGGSGAPAAQAKEYGVNLTLSSTVPTRTNYIFQGWATSASGAVAYQPGGTYTANAAVTLYAIWKLSASTLSSVTDTVNIGSSGTASWNILNTAYTYKLEITCGSAPTVTVNVAANTSSASFTIPTTWYSYFSNATSGTATAKLSTYNGSTLVGTSTKTFTVAVASSVKPTISSFTVTPYTGNQTVNAWGVFVQGYTVANLSVSATPGTGASISSIAFSGLGVAQSSLETTATSSVLNVSGSTSYTVVVTDSRGRSATSEVVVYVNEYNPPSISKFEAVRCTSNGTQSDTEGTYIKCRQTFTYSPVNKDVSGNTIPDNNLLTVNRVWYKKHTDSSWTVGVSSAASGNTWSNAFGGGNIEISSSYDLWLTVQDSTGTTNQAVLTIIVPPVVGFALGLKNDRARFGGPVERAGLQIDWRVYEPTGSWTHQAKEAGSGYNKIANIRILRSSAVGWPISLAISQRGMTEQSMLTIRFENANTNDPALSTFTVLGSTKAYMVKTGTGIWGLYVEKTNDSDWVEVVDFLFPQGLDGYVQFEWTDIRASSLPSGYIQATPSGRELKYRDDTSAANYTIGSNNYVAVPYPSGLNGNNVVSISMITWTSVSGPISIMPYGTGGATSWYMIGAAGTTLNGVKFRYWYV